MARISRTQFIALQKKLKMDSLIGRELGISRQAVYQIRLNYGIKSLVPDQTNRNAEMYKAYVNGATGLDIAKKFGVSVSQTYRVIRAMEEKKGKAAVKAVKKTVKNLSAKAAKSVAKNAAKSAANATVKKTAAKKAVATKTAAKKKPVKKSLPKKKSR